MASGEKLKLQKTYCRTSMMLERLVGLVILAIIEPNISGDIELMELVSTFDKVTARKIKFEFTL